MPTVAIARLEDKHRSFDRVYSLVREALSELGGFDAFVKPGQTVVIRPDQSVARSAQQGCTTDPLLIGALIRLAHHAGAAKVQVAASGSGFLNSIKCMRTTGVAAMAEQEGAELLDLGSDHVPNREVSLPEGHSLRRALLPVPLLEAEVIIAVPKAKTDYLDVISGSRELCAGSLNQRWRASQEGAAHTIERYADILTVLRPDLFVTDALVCGEGDGPHANIPRWCGCIMASSDPVAMDVGICMLLGQDWKRMQFAAAAESRGLGNREPVVFLGTSLERVAIKAWPSHEGLQYLPVNVLVGKDVTEFGTIGHVKSALESLLRHGVLQQSLSTAGTPTIMLGDVDDPEFERHLEEGPYIVFDDAAQLKYKADPRVFFVSGHPVTHDALPALTRILRMEAKKRRELEGSGRNRAAAAAAAMGLGAFLWMRGSGKRT